MNKTKIDNQTIAHILLDLRQKHHLSQEQLAQTLGVTRQAVSRWEMGISVPNIHTLLLISEQFHVPIDTMLKKPDASAENQNKIQNPAKRTPFIFMTITGIFLLCVLPFLGQWEQFKYMDLYGRAYTDSYHYIFEYPLSILLVLSIVLICGNPALLQNRVYILHIQMLPQSLCELVILLFLKCMVIAACLRFP